MSGPIVILYRLDGREHAFGALDADELAEMLPEVRRHDPFPVIVWDGLAHVRERLPVGARVRCLKHWKRQHGTVTQTDVMPSYPHWPAEGPAAWMLSHNYAEVCVRFDGEDWADWWPANWIEPA